MLQPYNVPYKISALWNISILKICEGTKLFYTRRTGARRCTIHNSDLWGNGGWQRTTGTNWRAGVLNGFRAWWLVGNYHSDRQVLKRLSWLGFGWHCRCGLLNKTLWDIDDVFKGCHMFMHCFLLSYTCVPCVENIHITCTLCCVQVHVCIQCFMYVRNSGPLANCTLC